MRQRLLDRETANALRPHWDRLERPEDREDIRDRLDDAWTRIDEFRDAIQALKALTGDPERLEPSDLDASDAFSISESEDGFVAVTTPFGTRETKIVFSEDTDSFADLVDLAQERQAQIREALDTLKALTGDPDKLEASDLDASEHFTVTESEDGFVVVTTPWGSHETNLAYGDDTDSFVDLAAKAREALAGRSPLDSDDPETELPAADVQWVLRDRLAERLESIETEPTPLPEDLSAAEDVPQAADYTGAGQTVVIIDDGYSLDYDQSATVFNYDFAGWRNDSSAQTSGIDSHGSWVAQSVIDEASGVEIVHLKVFSDDGGTASMRDIEEALDFVIAAAEVTDIAAVNLSLGYGNATEETTSALSDEFAELDALGVFSIVAAGNDGVTYDDGVSVLAADPNVIAVSAADDDGSFAEFSQTSETLTDIVADGVDVVVETVDGQVLEVSGTSFAAPEIAGIAARLQEAALATIGQPLTDEEFLEILQLSGEEVADAPDAQGYVVADGDAAVDYFLTHSESYGGMAIV